MGLNIISLFNTLNKSQPAAGKLTNINRFQEKIGKKVRLLRVYAEKILENKPVDLEHYFQLFVGTLI